MNNDKPSGKQADWLNTDSGFVKKIRGGDVPAFEELFNLYAEVLFRFAVYYVKFPQTAEDVVQEVFVNVWKNRKNLNPSLNIKSYLYSAVKNQSLKHLKHRKIALGSEKHVAASLQSAPKPDDVFSEAEFAAEVQKAVAELPEKCRQVFLLHRDKNLTYSEIAEVLEISINTVKTQMSRAFTSLRQRLTHFITFVI